MSENIKEETIDSLQFPNFFLTKEKKQLQRFAYFGRFLVLTDFDDGWKYQMQKQLLDYLSTIAFKGLNVEHMLDKKKGEILATLTATELNKDVEKDILDISTLLQKKFFMTEVEQRMGYGKSEESLLPIQLEDLSENDFGYERQTFQKQYIELLLFEQKIKDISDFIEVRKKLGADTATELLINELGILKKNFLQEIGEKKELLDSINIDFYTSLSLKEIFGEQKSTILKKAHNTMQNTIDDERFKNTGTSNEQKNSVECSEYTKGKIGDCLYDNDGIIISATILDTGEEINLDDSQLKGLKLKGLSGIYRLKTLEINEQGEVLFFSVHSNKNIYFYYFIDGMYEMFTIKGLKQISGLSDWEVDSTGRLLYGGVVKGNRTKNDRFWFQDGEYHLLNIDGLMIESFFDLNLNSNGEPLCGYYKEYSSNNRNYFWNEDGTAKILKIEGFNNISKILKITCNDEGKPLYGECEIKGKSLSINFILDENTGKYIKLKMFQKNPYKNLADNNIKKLN